jgi:hypothetical protein
MPKSDNSNNKWRSIPDRFTNNQYHVVNCDMSCVQYVPDSEPHWLDFEFKEPGCMWVSNNWIEIHMYDSYRKGKVFYAPNTLGGTYLIGPAYITDGIIFGRRGHSVIVHRNSVKFRYDPENMPYIKGLWASNYSRPPVFIKFKMQDRDIERYRKWHPKDDYPNAISNREKIYAEYAIRHYLGDWYRRELSRSTLFPADWSFKEIPHTKYQSNFRFH